MSGIFSLSMPSGFMHPGRLWLLVGLVALAAGYVAVHQQRRRALARYTNPRLAHLVAPTRSGWQRHLAPVFSLAALGVLFVGLAQPTRTERIPRKEGVVVLAIDVSASMTATDIAPSRIEAAITGATKFVKGIPTGIHVGLVAFDGTSRLLVAPTLDHSAVISAAQTLRPGPATAAGEGIYTSLDAIRATLSTDLKAAAKAGGHPAAIVLLSDGTTTVGRPTVQAARDAAAAGVPISTIAYGTPNGTVSVDGQVVDVPADTATMSEVARITGGKYFEATSAGQLSSVYANIQTTIGYTTQPREVTRGLLGVALILLVGGSAVGVFSTARAV
ncbi:MAG: von Willebrand factor type [Acidimicrobiales bacterium]|nr:von Willebrand factor type [Acidimicrobiales bacterium]